MRLCTLYREEAALTFIYTDKAFTSKFNKPYNWLCLHGNEAFMVAICKIPLYCTAPVYELILTIIHGLCLDDFKRFNVYELSGIKIIAE